MKYKSKVGQLWCGALAIIIGTSVWLFIDFFMNKDVYFGLLLLLVCNSLFLWRMFNIYYDLTEKHLEIRCAYFTHT